MNKLLYKEEVFQLICFCMEIHRELKKDQDEAISKDAFGRWTDWRWNSVLAGEKLWSDLQTRYPAVIFISRTLSSGI